MTVLFCDLTGSTAIGERTDPEALRALMNRYYAAARRALERHGGTVEKFVGDAVMAVFGIPVSTEEDALRAVRAAVEVLEVVHELGLEARVGVNTGPVVAGEGDTLVTGDAVNVAARLEQSAAAGEILLGDETLDLVRDAVETEPVELDLKGKSEAVRAHRLRALDVSASGVARRLERPMVGRVRESDRLRTDFADVVASRSCRLFTLIGPAGIGKSRLVEEFLEGLDGNATIARGRALSYGEGITYWPLVEMLMSLGIEPAAAIRSSPAETQLATRALFEGRAEETPLVLVIDDLQWAEAPMLDLVDHVADWVRAVPIMLVCIARPELLDVRPQWGGGKLNATSILLERLDDDEVTRLADLLLDGAELDAATRTRIVETADGNPLFLEEMAVLVRSAGGAVDVPPTIRALLQARLDTLDESERAVVERGAVEGQVFHRGAVTALAPDLPALDVAGRLVALVRKEVVRPERSLVAGDDAFRFRHLLIRDTAYDALPKAVRADLHMRFGRWLESNADLVEQDEIVGYHLEQAASYLRELEVDDERAGTLAFDAGLRLGAAGHAAFEREDYHAARNLLGRAVALLPRGVERRRLIPDLVDARLSLSDLDGLDGLIEELAGGDDGERATAEVLRTSAEPALGGQRSFAEMAASARAAATTLDELGDDFGVVRAERAQAMCLWALARVGESHRCIRSAHDRLRRSGSTAFQRELIVALLVSGVFAGRAVDDMRRLVDHLAGEAEEAGPLLSASLRSMRTRIDYNAGVATADEVIAVGEREAELLYQTGSRLEAVIARNFNCLVAWSEGDAVAEEERYREQIERYEEVGDRGFLANILASWAVACCRLGDAETALAAVQRGRSIARADDAADQIWLDAAEAYVRALEGRRQRADELIMRAYRALESIDMVKLADDVRHIDASCRAVLGDVDGARSRLLELTARAHEAGMHRWAAAYERELGALG